MNLEKKVCLITGAAQGIGRAIAEGFAKRGATVVATDLEACSGSGSGLEILPYDVSSPTAAEQLMEEVLRRHGRLDAFVANAGIMPRQKWETITPPDWERVLQVNLNGAWYGAKAAAAVMTPRGYGKIVFVSSVEVCLGEALHCHYDAAKAGLIGLTRAMARAVGRSGIRVNCLMPGAVQTDSERTMFPDEAGLARILGERQCLPHRLKPENLEPSAAFLCSEASDAVTGQVLCVDHGLIHY